MTRPEHAPSRQFAMDIESAAPRDTVWNAIAHDTELTRYDSSVDDEDGGKVPLFVEFQLQGEGDSFRIRTVDGDELSGEVLHCHPTTFTGVARSHADSFLRVSAFEADGVTHVWLWLATYGTANPENESLRARWETMLGRLFPERVNATFAGKV